MKVLQLCKFFPPHRGGIESVVESLCLGFIQRGIYVDVLCCNSSIRTTVEKPISRLNVTRCGTLFRILSTSVSIRLLFDLFIRRNKYDIIHLHLPDPMTCLAIFIARPHGKLIVHWHSDIVRQKMSLKLFKPLQNWILRRASRIVCTSDPYLKSSTQISSFFDKSVVIPIGIGDRNADWSNETEMWGSKFLVSAPRFVFSLGRLTYYKGFQYLIEAAHHIEEDVVIIIAGGGPDIEIYREKVSKAKLDGKVFFIGEVSDDQLCWLFSHCSVFCLPSIERSEAFGVVLLEAMSYRVPIVATNIIGSGVPWVNLDGVTGFNAKVGDSKHLAERINLILSDSQLSDELSRNGRARFESLFRLDNMIDNFDELYRDVASSKTT